MPTLNIAESFDHGPPGGTRASSEQFPDAHISGQSTLLAEAPGFALEVSYRNIWNRHANDVLRNVNLTRHRLASWEPTRQLLVEADVSDAAALQLINPVDLALSAHHPGEIVSLNQHIVGTARSDKCWYRCTPRGNKFFAVLDYKRPAVIRNWEFEEAMTNMDRYDQMVYKVQQSGRLFEGNSEILLKQAVNYADQYQTKYIAFFDWDMLLLLVMADQEGISGGTWCYATLIRNRGNVRRALLGFLERAYLASCRGESDLPSFIPPADDAGAGSSRRGRRR